jgi:hypothetical protein
MPGERLNSFESFPIQPESIPTHNNNGSRSRLSKSSGTNACKTPSQEYRLGVRAIE